MKIFEEYKDLEIGVEYEFIKDDVFIIFGAKEILGLENGTKPVYENDKNEIVDFKDAPLFISGTLKWDYCGSWHFGDEGNIHICGEKYAEKLGAIIVKIRDRCIEVMKENGVSIL